MIIRQTIIRPANLHDMTAHTAANNLETWPVLKDMYVKGDSWAADENGRIIALTGVYPLGGGDGEFWFWCLPDAAKAVLAFIRFGRLTLPFLGYRRLVFISPSEPGRRMARLLGFEEHTLDDQELWICQNY